MGRRLPSFLTGEQSHSESPTTLPTTVPSSDPHHTPPFTREELLAIVCEYHQECDIPSPGSVLAPVHSRNPTPGGRALPSFLLSSTPASTSTTPANTPVPLRDPPNTNTNTNTIANTNTALNDGDGDTHRRNTETSLASTIDLTIEPLVEQPANDTTPTISPGIDHQALPRTDSRLGQYLPKPQPRPVSTPADSSSAKRAHTEERAPPQQSVISTFLRVRMEPDPTPTASWRPSSRSPTKVCSPGRLPPRTKTVRSPSRTVSPNKSRRLTPGLVPNPAGGSVHTLTEAVCYQQIDQLANGPSLTQVRLPNHAKMDYLGRPVLTTCSLPHELRRSIHRYVEGTYSGILSHTSINAVAPDGTSGRQIVIWRSGQPFPES